jgi:hypothetical protein
MGRKKTRETVTILGIPFSAFRIILEFNGGRNE